MDPATDSHTAGRLRAYRDLIAAFLAGEVAAADFAIGVQRRISADPEPYGADSPAFRVLDDLFHDCEAFVDDPALRRPGDLDEAALAECARRALARIAALTGAPT